jgi:hypothetical protein
MKIMDIVTLLEFERSMKRADAAQAEPGEFAGRMRRLRGSERTVPLVTEKVPDCRQRPVHGERQGD